MRTRRARPDPGSQKVTADLAARIFLPVLGIMILFAEMAGARLLHETVSDVVLYIGIVVMFAMVKPKWPLRFLLLGLFLPCSVGAVFLLNALLDTSSAVEHETYVVDLHVANRWWKKRAVTRTAYVVEIAEWHPRGGSLSFDVPRGLYVNLERGTKAYVTTKSGALWMEWVVTPLHFTRAER